MTVGSHLTTDVVSDLLEGLLDETDRVTAEAHLASCAECTAVADALVEVRELLHAEGSAPPPPMPVDIEQRLSAAISVESAERADSTGVVSLGQARERKLSRKAGQFLIAAASVAVLAVGGGIVVNSINKDDPVAQIDPTPRYSSDVAGVPASRLYLKHGAKLSLDESTFAANASKLLTATKPTRPRNDQPSVMASPAICVRDTIEPQVLRDFIEISFDGKSAYLAITNPAGTDEVRGYVVTGCGPGNLGEVVHEATLPR